MSTRQALRSSPDMNRKVCYIRSGVYQDVLLRNHTTKVRVVPRAMNLRRSHGSFISDVQTRTISRSVFKLSSSQSAIGITKLSGLLFTSNLEHVASGLPRIPGAPCGIQSSISIDPSTVYVVSGLIAYRAKYQCRVASRS
jgi:hypothetical protein